MTPELQELDQQINALAALSEDIASFTPCTLGPNCKVQAECKQAAKGIESAVRHYRRVRHILMTKTPLKDQ